MGNNEVSSFWKRNYVVMFALDILNLKQMFYISLIILIGVTFSYGVCYFNCDKIYVFFMYYLILNYQCFNSMVFSQQKITNCSYSLRIFILKTNDIVRLTVFDQSAIFQKLYSDFNFSSMLHFDYKNFKKTFI